VVAANTRPTMPKQGKPKGVATMSKTEPKVEIHNEHREALALALYEDHTNASKVIGIEPINNLDHYRVECNSIRFRVDMLMNTHIHERYIANRGFDPRAVNSAPKLRWLN
jgi:hypothetical protein